MTSIENTGPTDSNIINMRKLIVRGNRTSTALLCAFLVLSTLCCLLPLSAFAKVEVLFSPRDNINYRIMEAVNLSEVCIDVATFDFTSREMADAMVNAKKKGLKVRLLVDNTVLDDEESQVQRLEEIGFDIKALKGKGKGGMRSAYLIFDGRLVIVGPYHLSGDDASYNYENAIFFDDPGIVETYQNEFDRLFGSRSIQKTTPRKTTESLLSTIIRPSSDHLQDSERAPILPERLESPAPPVEIWKDETATQTAPEDYDLPEPIKEPEPYKEEYTEMPEHHPKVKTTPDASQKAFEQEPIPMEPSTASDGFMDISFEELDKIFSKDSPLSEKEKEVLWPNYIGKYIKWTGEVSYTQIGLFKGTMIGFRHKRGTYNDTEVRFSIKKATKIMRINEGDVITYTARLLDWPTEQTPYYVLIDGLLE